MKNRIQCTTVVELAQVCAELTKQNVVFYADTHTLVVEITGY